MSAGGERGNEVDDIGQYPSSEEENDDDADYASDE